MVAVAFVHNLLRRHPACMVLLDAHSSADAGDQAGLDVFDDSAADLAEARALESSLWEVESLRNHYCPQVNWLLEAR